MQRVGSAIKLTSDMLPDTRGIYAVSAAVMRCQIAMLSGVTDIHLLFGIFGLTSTTMLFGWLMESTNGHKVVSKDNQVVRSLCM